MKKSMYRESIMFCVLLFVSACTNAPSNNAEIKMTIGDDLHLLPNVKFDYDNAIFDDFAEGVCKDNWYIGKQAWGGNNGGVIPANVNYSDDGVLILTGNGKYYSDNDVRGVGDVKDGRFTGGVLISKFKVHSGRFEIKMKVLPRLGACSAFWTYAYDTLTAANHEIDIELPGGSINRPVTFENVLNTNYITEKFKQSQDTKISSLYEEGEKEIFLNDGNFHVFGFDWYTDPELVVYYVDGKISAVSDVFVPSFESRLWLGCWFPVSSQFVGTANFEKDNMYVDYVKYIPFKDQPFEKFEPTVNGYALDNEYPSSPISIGNVNKVSNGNFENIEMINAIENNTTEIELYGWNLSRKLTEEKNLKEIISIEDKVGYDNSKALVIKDGAVAYQNIDSVYSGFTYDLSFQTKGKGRAIIAFYGKTTTETLDMITYNINEGGLKEITKKIVAPKGCQSIMIDFDTTEGNSLLIDNLSLLKV